MIELMTDECNISTFTDQPTIFIVFAMGSKVKRLMIPDYKLRIFLSQTFKVVTFAVVLIINLNTGNVCLQLTKTVCQAKISGITINEIFSV